MFSKIVKDSISSMNVDIIIRITLKPLCTFTVIYLSLYSLIDIFIHRTFMIDNKICIKLKKFQIVNKFLSYQISNCFGTFLKNTF